MNAKIMDIKRFAVHDGPGVRTTLFLKGCPLKCVWCHNPEGIAGGEQLAYYAHKCIGCGECATACRHGAHAMGEEGHIFDRAHCVSCGDCEPACLGEALKLFGRDMSASDVVRVALEDRVFYEQSGGGVTFSGGEPLLRADFCAAAARELKKQGISVAIDTCGCVGWEAFERVLPLTDIFLFDIKHIDSRAHERLTGQGNGHILDNLRRLSACGARIEIRMPLVPGLNDDEATIDGVARFLSALRIEKMRILPYHAMARSKYAALGMPDTMPEVSSPSDAQIARVVSRLKAQGVPAVSGRD